MRGHHRCHPDSPVTGPPTQTSPLLWENKLEGQLDEKWVFAQAGKIEDSEWWEMESTEALQCLRFQIVIWPFFPWSTQQCLSFRRSDHGSVSAFPVHCTHSPWAVWFDTWQQSNSGDQTSPQTLCKVTSNMYWHSKVHSGNMSGWAGTRPPCSARDSLNHRLQLPAKIKPKFK